MAEGSVHDNAPTTVPQEWLSTRDLIHLLEVGDEVVWADRKRTLTVKKVPSVYVGSSTAQAEAGPNEPHYFAEWTVELEGQAESTFIAVTWLRLPYDPNAGIEAKEKPIMDADDVFDRRGHTLSIWRSSGSDTVHEQEIEPFSADIIVDRGIDPVRDLDEYSRIIYTPGGSGEWHHVGEVVGVEYGEFVVEPFDRYTRLTEAEHTVSPEQVVAGRVGG